MARPGNALDGDSDRLRIGQRLAIGYGAIIALMGVILTITLLNLAHVRGANTTMLGEQAERLSLAREWRHHRGRHE